MVNLYLIVKAVRIFLRLLGGYPSKKVEGDEMGGHSSVGRVQASQAWCRGFEPRCPLQLEFAEEGLTPFLRLSAGCLSMVDLL